MCIDKHYIFFLMKKNHLSEGSGMFMPLHNKPAALTDSMSSQFKAANTNKEQFYFHILCFFYDKYIEPNV